MLEKKGAQMIRWSGNLGRISASEKVSFQMGPLGYESYSLNTPDV